MWVNDTKYGWKGTAFTGGKDGKNLAADAILWTPEFDFREYKEVRMTFDHAVNFCADPEAVLSVVMQIDGGNREPVTISEWPEGDSWTFVKGVTASLDACAGKKSRIGFRYTSTTSEAGTWEIKDMKVEGIKTPTSIDDLPGDLYNPDTDFEVEPEYYTIDGRRIADPSAYSGILIIRRGSRVTKVYVR